MTGHKLPFQKLSLALIASADGMSVASTWAGTLAHADT